MNRFAHATVVALALALVLSGVATSAAQEASFDPTAVYLVEEMSRRLAAAPAVTFHVEATVENVDDAGLKLGVLRTMEVALRRPDRLAMSTFGEEGRRGFRYDGETATIYHIDLQTYSVAEAPPSVDEALDMLGDRYGYELPLADLLHGDPASAMLAGATSGYYVGPSAVGGVPCHLVVFRQPGIDWELWIEDSLWFRPLRLVVTYTDIEGAPQYRATFSGWDYGAGLSDELFEFVPPPRALKIRWAERSK